MSQHYRFGIEEEFFVIDAASKAAQKRLPAGFRQELEERLTGDDGARGRLAGEVLPWQIEVGTAPGMSMQEVAEDLRNLRQLAGAVGEQHGLSILAAGTHPTATFDSARDTRSTRYDGMMTDLQMLAERSMVCGLHVQVELPDPDQRVDVMRRIVPYIPHFIALSTSSPFWASKQTGLLGYRLAAGDELPRTGLPEMFENNAAYERYVDALVAARMMSDSNSVWWVVRPSRTAPTLELRAPDSCTRFEDTIAIAALYRALVRFLVRNPHHNREVGTVDRAIADENKWRAQRYGIHGSFVDLTQRRAISVRDAVEGLVNLVAEDADALGSLKELLHVRTIAEQGTSADIQLAMFEEARHRTGNKRDALGTVTSWLAHTTLQ